MYWTTNDKSELGIVLPKIPSFPRIPSYRYGPHAHVLGGVPSLKKISEQKMSRVKA